MKSARRIVILLLVALIASIGLSTHSVSATKTPKKTKIFVDSDVGVDDAVAIAWLLQSKDVELVGFTTVNGNTTVDNATRNLLTLFAAARVQYPVTIGAAEPLEVPISHMSAFAHGPTGFWFSQGQFNISHLPTDAPAAIAAAARANPGMTLITLGPLTNVAQTIQRFPNDLRNVRIISVVGSYGPANRTPVAEFNAFADPHALDIVLESNLDITLITLDAFSEVKFDSKKFPKKLEQKGGDVGKLLASILTPYFLAESQGAGGEVALADVAGVFYALDPKLATPESALVDVSTDEVLTRGQTVMAFDPNGKITMIADDEELSELADRAFTDPNFDINMAMFEILMRKPDNAKVVLSLKTKNIVSDLEKDLTKVK